MQNDEYAERRRALDKLDVDDGETILVPAAYEGSLEDAIASSRKLGLEGVLAKRRDSRYVAGKRSSNWIKIKHQRMQEVVIGGWRDGNGARARLDRFAAARHPGRGRAALRRAGRHRLQREGAGRPQQEPRPGGAQDQPVHRRTQRRCSRCTLGHTADRRRGGVLGVDQQWPSAASDLAGQAPGQGSTGGHPGVTSTDRYSRTQHHRHRGERPDAVQEEVTSQEARGAAR